MLIIYFMFQFKIIFFRCILRCILLCFVFLLGFLWSFYNAYSISSWQLNKEDETKPIIITGYISSLPSQAKFGKNFEFYMEQLQHLASIEYPNSFIRLACPD